MRTLLVAFSLLSFHAVANASGGEVTLFNSKGKAIAYLAVSDEMTIYLWDGKPVAHLEPDKDTVTLHVYGFNGKHLGWFAKGVVRDHVGDVVCAVRERLPSTRTEPFKSNKEHKPAKANPEQPPSRPAFSKSFSDTGCSAFLEKGRE